MKHQLKLAVSSNHELYSNFTKKVKNFKRVYLLLHGYMQDGEFIFKKLQKSLPKDTLILAPNGAYLLPSQKNNQFSPKYAWYFFDPATRTYYINYTPAAEYLASILNEYNPQKVPVTVIGYSQGGYLSPKVSELVEQVDQIIGIACVFRNNKFVQKKRVIYHQIHGQLDAIVDINGARTEWDQLKKRGNNFGKFIEIPDVGHRLTNEYVDVIATLIA